VVAVIRSRVAPVLIAGALVLGVWEIAHAHATLLSAEPAAGSRLPASPARVRLVFSEQLEIGLAKISLTGVDGHPRALKVTGDPRDVRAAIAQVAGLTSGPYHVAWHVVSADGHPVDGGYEFSVGDSVASSTTHAVVEVEVTDTTVWAPAVAGAPLIPAVARGLAVGALMALAGVLLFVSLGRVPGDADPIAALAVARWLAIATVLLLAANFAAWMLNAAPDHAWDAGLFGAIRSTTAGRIEFWRGGLALLAAWAIWIARRAPLALVFAAAAVALSGAVGHSAAIAPVWNVPLKSVHLLASSAWLGGLLWLQIRRNENKAGFARDASRVSAVALASVLLVAVSGGVQTLINLPSPLDVFRSSYGAVALLKTGGLLTLVGFGAWHRYRVMPRLATDGAAPALLAASVRRELVLMFAVVLLGGLLSYVRPPDGTVPSTHSSTEHDS